MNLLVQRHLSVDIGSLDKEATAPTKHTVAGVFARRSTISSRLAAPPRSGVECISITLQALPAGVERLFTMAARSPVVRAGIKT